MICTIKDNYLCLPIGTKLYIKQQGFVNKQINLINGRNQKEFFAIFHENDVDFEICCDNRESDFGIAMKLTINQKSKSFYIRPQNLSTFKALETNGRKLHFISQNTDNGRVLVAQTAHKHGISYELASIKCSRIEFDIDVEKCKNNVYISKFMSLNVTLIGTKIQLFVKTLGGKIITIVIGLNNTVNDLKKIIAKREGIPRYHQLLIFYGNQLGDDKELLDYHILNESTLHLILRLLGGEDESDMGLTQVKDDTQLTVNDKTDSLKNSSSNGNTEAYDSNGSELFSGERGVICYGEQSNQQFESYNGFLKDHYLLVNSFV